MSLSQQREASQKKVRLHCPNPNCDYSWMYTGRLLHYATCPSCRRNVKIQNNKTETSQSVAVSSPSQVEAVKSTLAEANV
jgi:hypothetical protein